MAFSDPRYVFFLAGLAIVALLLPRGRLRLASVLVASLLFAMGLGATAIVMPTVGLVAFAGGLVLAKLQMGAAELLRYSASCS